MATGLNPSGFAIPNPNPRKISEPIKKPIPMTGLEFLPKPKPIELVVTHGYILYYTNFYHDSISLI